MLGEMTWQKRKYGASDFDDTRLRPYTVLKILFELGVDMSGYLINLGSESGNCNSGLDNYDIANCMLQDGYGGVFVEPNKQIVNQTVFNSLPSNQRDEVVVLNDFMNKRDANLKLAVALSKLPPSSNASEIVKHPVRPSPANIDFLKIDIDSDDLNVLKAMLAGGFRPKVLQIEFMSSFLPPPFEVICPVGRAPDGGVQSRGAHLVDIWKKIDDLDLHEQVRESLKILSSGDSLTAFGRILQSYGYELMHVDKVNAVFIAHKYRKMLPWFSKATDYRKWLVSFCDVTDMPRFREMWSIGVDPGHFADTRVPIERRAEKLIHTYITFENLVGEKWPCQLLVGGKLIYGEETERGTVLNK